MRALVLDGTLFGPASPPGGAPLLRFSSGESVFGRQLRVLAANGVIEVAVVTGIAAERLRAELTRLGLTRTRLRHFAVESLAADLAELRQWLAGDNALVLTDDLVFAPDLVEGLLGDPRPHLALCDDEVGGGRQPELPSSAGSAAPAPVSPGDAEGLRVLARGGNLDAVGAGLVGGGSRGFWPLLKLTGDAAATWLAQLAGGPADAAAALNRVAADLRVGLLPASGRFVAQVGRGASFDELAERTRLVDLRRQRTVAEPRGYVRLGAELARLGVGRVLLVADRSFERRDLADYLGEMNLDAVRFSEFSPVPTWLEVRAAVQTFRAHACDGVLTVGGEAAIGVGKLVKLLAAVEPTPAALGQPAGFSGVGHVVIPTAGSAGAESTTEAVLQVDGELRRIRQDCLLPDVVFLDPTVWDADPEADRRSAVLGALSQSVAASWGPAATDQSREHASAALELLLDGVFDFVKGDLPGVRAAMLTAINLSGKAANLAGPSLLDVLSYPLAARLGCARGEAATLCLPALWRRLVQQIPAVGDIPRASRFRSDCDLLAAKFGAETVDQAIVRVERITQLLRADSGRSRAAQPDAVRPDGLADAELGSPSDLELSPLPMTADELRAVYDRTLQQAVATVPERTDFEILVRFGAFCRERGLNCHLFGQTLRDAVTIGRLSPWSGPITVAMPRASFDKLVRWRDQLPAQLWLDDAAVNPGRSTVSPRLVWSGGIRPVEPDALPGITIRVLESANYGSAPSQLARRSALLVLHRATLAAENGKTKSSAGIAQAIGELGERLGVDRLGRLRVQWTEDARRRPGAHTYVDPGLTTEFARSQFLAVWFGKTGEQTLNGERFQAPVQPEAVLNRLFGSGFGDSRAIPTGPIPDVPLAVTPLTADPPPSAAGPFVSVVLPVYNVAEYLPACLDSLCLQDTDGYEIIAVDDGSTDGSLTVLREYERRFPGLLRVVCKPNGGLSDARNFGMGLARGEYLAFVDSDDLVSPSLVRLMKEKAAATDADVVVCNHAEYWGESDRAEVRWMSFINSYGHSVSERPELLVAVHPYAWNKLYRRRLFDDFEISYPAGQAFEDSATTFNLLLHANKIEYVDEALYFYRMDRAGSITNTFNQKFYDIFKSFDSIREFYARHGRYDEFREEISELMRRTAFARVTALEACRDPGQVQDFLQAIYDYLDEHAPNWAENKYFRRQMANPKYADEPKYRSMHSRQLMLKYFERIWQNRGEELAVAQGHSTSELIGMLQQEELQILLQIDRFCADRGFTYYLAEGSLLGAIRHQGFVPWDDDVDIVMPRADYELFLAALAREEEPALRLFHERTYPRYHLTFAKVLSTRPSGFINSKIAVPPEFQGPCVDVFPLDAAPRRRDLAAERRIRRLRDMLLFKAGFMSEKTKRERSRSYRSSKLVTFGYLQRAIQRLYRKHEDDPKATWLVNFASSYPVDREKVRAACYGEPQRVPFEGHLLPVPADWDTVLSTTYGRYMELPPVDQRQPRHRPRWRELDED